MQFILSLISMIVCAIIFTVIKKQIFNRVKKTGKTYMNQLMKDKNFKIKFKDEYKKLQIEQTNCSIGKQHKKKSFNWNKFKDNFTITKSEGKHWAKILAPWVNWRNWTIFLFIAGVLYGYGYWKGIQNVPIQINLAYEKAFKMKIDGHYLVKPKNSQNIQIEDKEGNIIKHLKVKDFPDLAKKLKPIGFIFEPIGIMGVGTGTETKGFEAGAGISFIKYWKWRLDTFLTNRGVYVGTSYQLTSNSATGTGIGKGYEGDSRMILYYKWGF